MATEPAHTSTLSNAAVELLWRGDMIGAIKVVRQERNTGLNESRNMVDAYIASQPALKKKMDKVLATAQQRFIRLLIGFLILATGIAYLVWYVL